MMSDEIIDFEEWKRAQQGKPSHKSGLRWASTSDIFAPIPDPVWACKALEIAPGRPTCFAGYSYSGKTLAVQSAVLAMVAGRSVFGQFPVTKPQRIRHIDYEQGKATFRRYQRLARGHRIDPDELGGRLECCLFPELNVKSSSDEQWMTVCQGWDVVVVDALRGLLGDLDENSSEVQTYLSRLTDISTRTGTSFLIIHHAGKGNPKDKDEREILRGSSAIFAAFGSVFAMLGKKDESKVVRQVKSHPDAVGACRDDFELSIVDVPYDGDPYWGLHVGYSEAEEDDRPSEEERLWELASTRVLSTVRAHPGASSRDVRQLCGGKRDDVTTCLRLLEEAGRIQNQAKNKRDFAWYEVNP